MASRTVVALVDDVDGGPAEQTVQFVLDGVGYQIDLNAENARTLRDHLRPFLRNARVVGRAPSMIVRPAQPARLDPAQSAKIREWAAANGHQVNQRGRIPQQVLDAFQAAHTR